LGLATEWVIEVEQSLNGLLA